MIYTRRAVPRDLEQLLPLCRQFHAESPVHSKRVFEDARVEQLILDALVNDTWLAVVAVDEDEIVGMGLFYAFPTFFGPDIEVGDLTFYVTPDRRGSHAAVGILEEVCKWAELKGAAHLQIGLNTGIREAAALRFFTRFGFERTGIVLRREAGANLCIERDPSKPR